VNNLEFEPDLWRTHQSVARAKLTRDQRAGFRFGWKDRTRNLPETALFRILEVMEVHFTPEQEAQLSQIATKAGTDAERLVKEAALRLLQEDARFRAAVREGVAQADRGEFIEEDEMDARIEQMLRS
jgi:predicted transcriptional regulator